MNQVEMLVGPPPKTRSFFSFLNRQAEENFDDQE